MFSVYADARDYVLSDGDVTALLEQQHALAA